MEHKGEKTIRDKVNSLDEPSIAWRKEFVWSEISSGTTSRSRSNGFYYAAASLILIITAFSLNEVSKRKQLDARLRLLEAGINQIFNSPTSSNSLVPDKIETVCLESKTIITLQKKVGKKLVSHHSITASAYENDHPVNESYNEVAIEISIEQPDSVSNPMREVPAKQNKKKVHAIFSTEASPTLISTSTKDKKIKLRLFRQEEQTESDIIIREPINLTARINKK